MINEQWALVTVIGFWGWVLATVWFIFRVFPARHIFVKRNALRCGGVILLFFIIWLLGMLNA